jgi:FMN reductase
VRFVTLVGNPRPGSRTLTVAAGAAEAIALALRLDPDYEIIDLSVLARRLLLPGPSVAVEDAAELVSGADLLLVVSPTFKGTYSGLLKVFLDRLPYRALAGTVALPLLVMASPQHALAVEVHLRPLLVELGATVPGPGLAVLESELGRLDAVLRPWASRLAGMLDRGDAAGQRMPAHAVTRSARWARDLSRWSGGNGGNPMCWRSELGTADQS